MPTSSRLAASGLVVGDVLGERVTDLVRTDGELRHLGAFSLVSLRSRGWCGRSADEAAAGVVEAAGDGAVDDVVADLDPEPPRTAGSTTTLRWTGRPYWRASASARRARSASGSSRATRTVAMPWSWASAATFWYSASATATVRWLPARACLTRLRGRRQGPPAEQVVDQAGLVLDRAGRVGERVAQRRVLLHGLREREQLVGQTRSASPPAARTRATTLRCSRASARSRGAVHRRLTAERSRTSARSPTLPPTTCSTTPCRASAATEASVTKRRSPPSAPQDAPRPRRGRGSPARRRPASRRPTSPAHRPAWRRPRPMLRGSPRSSQLTPGVPVSRSARKRSTTRP